MKTERHDHRRRWFVGLTVATLMLVGGGIAAAVTFEESTTGSDAVADNAPAWLQEIISSEIGNLAKAQVKTASYALVTNAALHDAVPDLGPVDSTLSEKKFYVVVANGEFTSGRHMLGAEAATDPYLVICVSAETENVTTIGIFHEAPDTAALGDMSPITIRGWE